MTSEILFVGPFSGGGMTAVIDTLCGLFPGSRCVCSYRGGSKVRKAWDAACGLLRMASLLARHPQIKIVHIHTASNASFRRKMHFARMAKRMGRKVVMHIHGGGFADFIASDPRGIVADLNALDAVVCLSQGWAEILANAGVKHINVIPNPVAVPLRVDVRPDGLLHFIFLGLIHREKGVFDLLQAIAANRARWEGKLMFHIGGTGPELEDMRRFIADNGLNSIVKTEGWVDGHAKAHLFSQASALILPSYVEAMPISILEAMSYGLPVIATPVGAIPSIVTEGTTGLLVQPADTRALADAIDRLASDEPLRRQMGANALKAVVPYSPTKIADSLLSLYRNL